MYDTLYIYDDEIIESPPLAWGADKLRDLGVFSFLFGFSLSTKKTFQSLFAHEHFGENDKRSVKFFQFYFILWLGEFVLCTAVLYIYLVTK